MDLNLTPDIYTPGVDTNGNYIDVNVKILNGIYCPCNKNKVIYKNASSFCNHKKSKNHQKWLNQLTNDKANYYVKLMELNEIYESQKKIIQQLENELKKKSLLIDYLTEQVTNNNLQNISTNIDLLEINE
jgi:hypothetical protein